MLKLEVQAYNFNSLCHQCLFPKSLTQSIWSILGEPTIFSYLYYQKQYNYSV